MTPDASFAYWTTFIRERSATFTGRDEVPAPTVTILVADLIDLGNLLGLYRDRWIAARDDVATMRTRTGQ